MTDSLDNLRLGGGKLIKELTVIELKSALEQRGLSKYGNKRELSHRLSIFEENQQKSFSPQPTLEAPNQWLENESDLNNDFLREYFQSQKALFQEQTARKNLIGKSEAPAATTTTTTTLVCKQSTVRDGSSTTPASVPDYGPSTTPEKVKSKPRGRPKKKSKEEKKQEALASSEVITTPKVQKISISVRSIRSSIQSAKTDDISISKASVQEEQKRTKSRKAPKTRDSTSVENAEDSQNESPKLTRSRLRSTKNQQASLESPAPVILDLPKKESAGPKIPSLKIKIPELVPKVSSPISVPKENVHSAIKYVQESDIKKTKKVCLSPQNAEVSSSVQEDSPPLISKLKLTVIDSQPDSTDNDGGSVNSSEELSDTERDTRYRIQNYKAVGVTVPLKRISSPLSLRFRKHEQEKPLQKPVIESPKSLVTEKLETHRLQSGDVESVFKSKKNSSKKKLSEKISSKRDKIVPTENPSVVAEIALSHEKKIKKDLANLRLRPVGVDKDILSHTPVKSKEESIRRSTRLTRTSEKTEKQKNVPSSIKKISFPTASKSARPAQDDKSYSHPDFLASLKQQIEMPLHIDKFPCSEKNEVSSTTELSECSKPRNEFAPVKCTVSSISKETPILDAHIAVEGHLDGNITPDSHGSELFTDYSPVAKEADSLVLSSVESNTGKLESKYKTKSKRDSNELQSISTSLSQNLPNEKQELTVSTGLVAHSSLKYNTSSMKTLSVSLKKIDLVNTKDLEHFDDPLLIPKQSDEPDSISGSKSHSLEDPMVTSSAVSEGIGGVDILKEAALAADIDDYDHLDSQSEVSYDKSTLAIDTKVQKSNIDSRNLEVHGAKDILSVPELQSSCPSNMTIASGSLQSVNLVSKPSNASSESVKLKDAALTAVNKSDSLSGLISKSTPKCSLPENKEKLLQEISKSEQTLKVGEKVSSNLKLSHNLKQLSVKLNREDLLSRTDINISKPKKSDSGASSNKKTSETNLKSSTSKSEEESTKHGMEPTKHSSELKESPVLQKSEPEVSTCSKQQIRPFKTSDSTDQSLSTIPPEEKSMPKNTSTKNENTDKSCLGSPSTKEIVSSPKPSNTCNIKSDITPTQSSQQTSKVDMNISNVSQSKYIIASKEITEVKVGSEKDKSVKASQFEEVEGKSLPKESSVSQIKSPVSLESSPKISKRPVSHEQTMATQSLPSVSKSVVAEDSSKSAEISQSLNESISQLKASAEESSNKKVDITPKISQKKSTVSDSKPDSVKSDMQLANVCGDVQSANVVLTKSPPLDLEGKVTLLSEGTKEKVSCKDIKSSDSESICTQLDENSSSANFDEISKKSSTLALISPASVSEIVSPILKDEIDSKKQNVQTKNVPTVSKEPSTISPKTDLNIGPSPSNTMNISQPTTTKPITIGVLDCESKLSLESQKTVTDITDKKEATQLETENKTVICSNVQKEIKSSIVKEKDVKCSVFSETSYPLKTKVRIEEKVIPSSVIQKSHESLPKLTVQSDPDHPNTSKIESKDIKQSESRQSIIVPLSNLQTTTKASVKDNISSKQSVPDSSFKMDSVIKPVQKETSPECSVSTGVHSKSAEKVSDLKHPVESTVIESAGVKQLSENVADLKHPETTKISDSAEKTVLEPKKSDGSTEKSTTKVIQSQISEKPMKNDSTFIEQSEKSGVIRKSPNVVDLRLQKCSETTKLPEKVSESDHSDKPDVFDSVTKVGVKVPQKSKEFEPAEKVTIQSASKMGNVKAAELGISEKSKELPFALKHLKEKPEISKKSTVEAGPETCEVRKLAGKMTEIQPKKLEINKSAEAADLKPTTSKINESEISNISKTQEVESLLSETSKVRESCDLRLSEKSEFTSKSTEETATESSEINEPPGKLTEIHPENREVSKSSEIVDSIIREIVSRSETSKTSTVKDVEVGISEKSKLTQPVTIKQSEESGLKRKSTDKAVLDSVENRRLSANLTEQPEKSQVLKSVEKPADLRCPTESKVSESGAIPETNTTMSAEKGVELEFSEKSKISVTSGIKRKSIEETDDIKIHKFPKDSKSEKVSDNKHIEKPVIAKSLAQVTDLKQSGESKIAESAVKIAAFSEKSETPSVKVIESEVCGKPKTCESTDSKEIVKPETTKKSTEGTSFKSSEVGDLSNKLTDSKQPEKSVEKVADFKHSVISKVSESPPMPDVTKMAPVKGVELQASKKSEINESADIKQSEKSGIATKSAEKTILTSEVSSGELAEVNKPPEKVEVPVEKVTDSTISATSKATESVTKPEVAKLSTTKDELQLSEKSKTSETTLTKQSGIAGISGKSGEKAVLESSKIIRSTEKTSEIRKPVEKVTESTTSSTYKATDSFIKTEVTKISATKDELQLSEKSKTSETTLTKQSGKSGEKADVESSKIKSSVKISEVCKSVEKITDSKKSATSEEKESLTKPEILKLSTQKDELHLSEKSKTSEIILTKQSEIAGISTKFAEAVQKSTVSGKSEKVTEVKQFEKLEVSTPVEEVVDLKHSTSSKVSDSVSRSQVTKMSTVEKVELVHPEKLKISESTLTRQAEIAGITTKSAEETHPKSSVVEMSEKVAEVKQSEKSEVSKSVEKIADSKHSTISKVSESVPKTEITPKMTTVEKVELVLPENSKTSRVSTERKQSEKAGITKKSAETVLKSSVVIGISEKLTQVKESEKSGLSISVEKSADSKDSATTKAAEFVTKPKIAKMSTPKDEWQLSEKSKISEPSLSKQPEIAGVSKKSVEQTVLEPSEISRSSDKITEVKQPEKSDILKSVEKGAHSKSSTTSKLSESVLKPEISTKMSTVKGVKLDLSEKSKLKESADIKQSEKSEFTLKSAKETVHETSKICEMSEKVTKEGQLEKSEVLSPVEKVDSESVSKPEITKISSVEKDKLGLSEKSIVSEPADMKHREITNSPARTIPLESSKVTESLGTKVKLTPLQKVSDLKHSDAPKENVTCKQPEKSEIFETVEKEVDLKHSTKSKVTESVSRSDIITKMSTLKECKLELLEKSKRNESSVVKSFEKPVPVSSDVSQVSEKLSEESETRKPIEKVTELKHFATSKVNILSSSAESTKVSTVKVVELELEEKSRLSESVTIKQSQKSGIKRKSTEDRTDERAPKYTIITTLEKVDDSKRAELSKVSDTTVKIASLTHSEKSEVISKRRTMKADESIKVRQSGDLKVEKAGIAMKPTEEKISNVRRHESCEDKISTKIIELKHPERSAVSASAEKIADLKPEVKKTGKMIDIMPQSKLYSNIAKGVCLGDIQLPNEDTKSKLLSTKDVNKPSGKDENNKSEFANVNLSEIPLPLFPQKIAQTVQKTGPLSTLSESGKTLPPKSLISNIDSKSLYEKKANEIASKVLSNKRLKKENRINIVIKNDMTSLLNQEQSVASSEIGPLSAPSTSRSVDSPSTSRSVDSPSISRSVDSPSTSKSMDTLSTSRAVDSLSTSRSTNPLSTDAFGIQDASKTQKDPLVTHPTCKLEHRVQQLSQSGLVEQASPSSTIENAFNQMARRSSRASKTQKEAVEEPVAKEAEIDNTRSKSRRSKDVSEKDSKSLVTEEENMQVGKNGDVDGVTPAKDGDDSKQNHTEDNSFNNGSKHEASENSKKEHEGDGMDEADAEDSRQKRRSRSNSTRRSHRSSKDSSPEHSPNRRKNSHESPRGANHEENHDNQQQSPEESANQAEENKEQSQNVEKKSESPFKSARKVILNRSRSSIEEDKPKKKKWGSISGPTSSAIDISSDTLKTLVPDMKPLSPGELTLQLESGREMEEFQQELDEEEEREARQKKETEEMEEGERRSDEEGQVHDSDAEHSGKKDKKREKGKRDGSQESKRKRHKRSTSRDRDKSRSKKEERRRRRSGSPQRRSPIRDRSGREGRKVREVDTVSTASNHKVPVSASRIPISRFLMIRNLVRPFTLKQLKDLIQRTGKIQPDGFWIDQIKSKCITKLENEDQALETRMALHGVKWPVSNPKTLIVEYCSEDEFKKRFADVASHQLIAAAEEQKIERKRFDRPVREWDLEKLGERSPGERERERERRRREKENKVKDHEEEESTVRERPSRREEKVSKKAPVVKSLDDLFKKTKAQPSIYWLSLTLDQIADKEVLRRKRMDETERRLAELEAEREKRLKEREEEREKERLKRQQREKERAKRSGRSRSRSRRRGGSSGRYSPRRSRSRSPRRSRRSSSRENKNTKKSVSKSKSRSPASRSRSRS